MLRSWKKPSGSCSGKVRVETFGLLMLWGMLLLGPPMALVLAISLRSAPSDLIRKMHWICIAAIGIVALGWVTGVGWLSGVMNVLSVALAYLAYCMVMGLSWVRGRSIPRYALSALATLPIVGGYLLGTIGALPLVFFLGDILSPPRSEVMLRPSLVCQVKDWGYAFSDEGYDVILYRSLPGFPWIGWVTRSVRVNVTTPGVTPASADCQGVAKGLI